MPEFAIETDCVHAGVDYCRKTGAVLTPIYQSTTFVQNSVEEYLSKGYSYSRTANPTCTALESKIKTLENGSYAICFGTGMAATCAVISGILKNGDHCIVGESVYGGTIRATRHHFTKMGIEFTYVDLRNFRNAEKAVQKNTKMLISECLTNPTLQVCDVEALSNLCHQHSIIHVCDTTFTTPVILKGLDFGADIVLVSMTKYYDGHNITTGGAVITNNEEYNNQIQWIRNVMGSIIHPPIAFYLLQTLKTLHLRVVAQCKSASKIALFLENHPRIDTVIYPGLKSYSQNEIALKQHKDGLHGSIVCFEIKDSEENCLKFLRNVKAPWVLAENLGSTESLLTYPAVFTHAVVPEEERMKIGISNRLIRASVGIENTQDLIEGLRLGLEDI